MFDAWLHVEFPRFGEVAKLCCPVWLDEVNREVAGVFPEWSVIGDGVAQQEQGILKDCMFINTAPVSDTFGPAAVVTSPRGEALLIPPVGKIKPPAGFRDVIHQRETAHPRHRHKAHRMTGWFNFE